MLLITAYLVSGDKVYRSFTKRLWKTHFFSNNVNFVSSECTKVIDCVLPLMLDKDRALQNNLSLIYSFSSIISLCVCVWLGNKDCSWCWMISSKPYVITKPTIQSGFWSKSHKHTLHDSDVKRFEDRFAQTYLNKVTWESCAGSGCGATNNLQIFSCGAKDELGKRWVFNIRHLIYCLWGWMYEMCV